LAAWNRANGSINASERPIWVVVRIDEMNSGGLYDVGLRKLAAG